MNVIWFYTAQNKNPMPVARAWGVTLFDVMLAYIII